MSAAFVLRKCEEYAAQITTLTFEISERRFLEKFYEEQFRLSKPRDMIPLDITLSMLYTET
jgi:hypothetical protein